MPIFLLLVAVPIIEIALFIQVGGWLGLWPTLGVVILTALIGALLLRSQGLATLGELQRRLSTGEDPSATLAHGAMILVAGVLLLTPGFFTDGIGFLLLTPPARAAVIRFARARIIRVDMGKRGWAGPGHNHAAEAGPGTVDGEYEAVDPDDNAPGGGGPGGAKRGGNSGWTQVPDDKHGS
jgi:UPF0716 protein FxsA